jgi:alkane 1-monooxygenase
MRVSDLRFLIALLLPMLTLVTLAVQPARAAIGTLAVWWLIALVDACVPGFRSSPGAIKTPARRMYFGGVLRAYALLQLALLAVGATAVRNADWPVVLGIAFSVGFVTGSQGITFAHELGHSKSKIDRFCAWLLMTTVCYGQFMVEHYRGHHVRAATHEDPATARFGESFYQFFPRTLWGNFRGAWQLEAQRVHQRKASWLRSPLVWSTFTSLALIAVPALSFQAGSAMKYIAYFVLQSVVAFTLLEIVNYIEHYGLQRKAAGNGGRREPFGLMHAWNANHLATNSLLVNLQRHSDHHMHPGKIYPELDALPGPQLPTGYAGCLILALLPPLWFALMNPRLAMLATPEAAV